MNKILPLIVCLLLLAACQDQKKVGVLDLNSVFDNFNYTKELKVEMTKKTEFKQRTVDSLYRKTQLLVNEYKTSPNSALRQKIASIENEFTKQSMELEQIKSSYIEESDNMILKQLDEYIDMYGAQHGFTLILSQHLEDASILYASEAVEITDEIILFLYFSSCTNHVETNTSAAGGPSTETDGLDLSVNEISNNQTTSAKEFREVSFRAITISPEFRAQQLYDRTSPRYKEELELQKSSQVFNLKIEAIGDRSIKEMLGDKFEDQSQFIDFFNYSFQNSVKLYSSKDTLSPELCHLEQPHMQANFLNVILVFQNDNKTNSKPQTLFINDKLFNLGRLKLRV